MIAALSRQADLNRFSAHLLHNLVLELTRLDLELVELKNRNLQLAGPRRAHWRAGRRRSRTCWRSVRRRSGPRGASRQ